MLQGARDWMSGMIPQHDDLDDHHIVPDWWGREYLTNGQANTIPKMRGVVSEFDAELAKRNKPVVKPVDEPCQTNRGRRSAIKNINDFNRLVVPLR